MAVTSQHMWETGGDPGSAENGRQVLPTGVGRDVRCRQHPADVHWQAVPPCRQGPGTHIREHVALIPNVVKRRKLWSHISADWHTSANSLSGKDMREHPANHGSTRGCNMTAWPSLVPAPFRILRYSFLSTWIFHPLSKEIDENLAFQDFLVGFHWISGSSESIGNTSNSDDSPVQALEGKIKILKRQYAAHFEFESTSHSPEGNGEQVECSKQNDQKMGVKRGGMVKIRSTLSSATILAYDGRR
ncbi:hypothetical protein B0H13DRAFT_1857766 [Mycena leptocephala]|nr:hypothetical protein B0H13DRAFT_1857766 [Mycena leptocephala]